MDCFAEPFIGPRFARTRWLAMTSGNRTCPTPALSPPTAMLPLADRAVRTARHRPFALSCAPDSSHIPAMAKNPDTPKKPAKPRNPRRQIPRRLGPTCSRSGRRWRNCSIPRSIAARAASARPPACSRRRIIPGTAAPAAKPPRIARGPRRAARARMWRSGMLSLTARRRFFFLPSPRASSAWWGGVGGGGWCHRHLRPWGTPHPRPSPTRGEGEEKQAGSALSRDATHNRAVSTKRPGQLRHRRHDSDARSGTGEATRLHHRGRRRRRAGASAAQQDGGARRRRHRRRAGSPDPRRPARIQGRRRPAENLDAASAAAPGKIRRRRALRDQVRISSRRATSRPRSPNWSRASSATTAPRCCSASPEPARPTPWPR